MKAKLAIALIASLVLASCASTTSPDGAKKTAPDRRTVNSILGFGRDILAIYRTAPAEGKPIKPEK